MVVFVQRSLFDVPESATSAMSDEDMFNEVSTQVHITTRIEWEGSCEKMIQGADLWGATTVVTDACLVWMSHGACDVRCSGERADV